MSCRFRYVVCAMVALAPGVLVAADRESRDPEVAPIYATVDWPDPLNPAFAPLGQDRFLFSTRTGLQVWDAVGNRFTPAVGWPAHTALPLHARWTSLGARTVVVGSYHDDHQIERHRLLGWHGEKEKFLASIDIPSGWLVHQLFPVDEQRIVACLRPIEWNEWSIDAIPEGFVARVASWRNESLTWSDPPSMEKLRTAGVRGPVADVGEIVDTPGGASPPVYFDTRVCAWRMRSPPEAMAKGRHLTIKPYHLPDGRITVGQAEWIATGNRERTTIRTPLLWDTGTQRWQETTNTAALDSDNAPFNYRAFGPYDRIVSLCEAGVSERSISSGFLEFFDSSNFRWIRSQQLLPPSFPPTKFLAPLSSGQVLAFLGDGAGIVRLDPFTESSGRRFLTSHDRWGDALLSGNRLLLGSGDYNKEPYNRPEIVNIATGRSRPIAPLPEPMNNPSAVELPDRTILVFGGLPPGCGPYQDWNHCADKPAVPAYRYSPEEDLWQTVPSLAPNFAGGPYWAAGASDIANWWPRTDFQLTRDGTLYFLDSGNWHQSIPTETRLFHWRTGSPVEQFGNLRQPRIRASLVQLRDGRLLVVGGATPTKASANVLMGPKKEAAEGCEIFNIRSKRWQSCPRPHFSGGRAVKLTNGRIFKLSMRDWTPEFGYRAEVADAHVRRWTRLPNLPAKFGEVGDMYAFGQWVLVLPDKVDKPVALWDDRRRRWSLVKMDLPEDWVSILPLNPRRAVVRTQSRVKIVVLPR
jgi:hypothetical protein